MKTPAWLSSAELPHGVGFQRLEREFFAGGGGHRHVDGVAIVGDVGVVIVDDHHELISRAAPPGGIVGALMRPPPGRSTISS